MRPSHVLKRETATGTPPHFQKGSFTAQVEGNYVMLPVRRNASHKDIILSGMLLSRVSLKIMPKLIPG